MIFAFAFAGRWGQLLGSLFDQLEPAFAPDRHVVLYAIVDRASAAGWSALLRLAHDLRSMARLSLGSAGEQFILRPVPAFAFHEAGMSTLPSQHPAFELRAFVFSVYDQLERGIAYKAAKPLHQDPEQQDSVHVVPVQFPSFTLAARGLRTMIKLDLKWPQESIDLLDRGMLLHLAYDLGQTVLVSAIDQRGEAYAVHSWESKGSTVADLKAVWMFGLDFARRASVTWRMVICKVSPMGKDEVQGEHSYLLLGPRASTS